MGPKSTTTTNAATSTANDFQGWLQSMLNGSGSSTTGSISNLVLDPVTGRYVQRPGTSGSSADAGSNTSFQQAFQNMLNGQVNDQSGANQAIQNSIGSGPQTFGQNGTNQYNNQTFSGANLSQLPTNLLQGSGQADLSGYGNIPQSNVNTGYGMDSLATSSYGNVLNQLLGQGSMMANQTGPQASASQADIGPGIALKDATQFDMNDPYFKALKDQQDRRLQNAMADNNERFSANGAGAVGTGAQISNASLQSQSSANDVVALQQALQGLQQQDLAERGTAANVGLSSRGQDAQVGIANMNAALQASLGNQNAGIQSQGNNNQLLAAMLGATNQARGQDFQNQQTTNAQNIDRTGMSLQQSLGNQGAALTNQNQMLQALLQNQQQGNQYGIAGANLNSQNQQLNNSNQVDLASMLNSFNLTNAGNNANFGQQAINQNNQSYQGNQQNWLNTLGLGQNLNNTSNQNTQNALQQLMASLQQSSQLGMPQAQVNQSTPWWQSAIGAVLPIAGQAFGSWMNNRGGGGGGASTTGWQNPVGTTNNGPISTFRQG